MLQNYINSPIRSLFKNKQYPIINVGGLALGLAALFLISTPSNTYATNFNQSKIDKLNEFQWQHGSNDCKANKLLAFQSYSHDQKTFILRQDKCTNYEAPFIYVLEGERKILVLDTGAEMETLHSSLVKNIEKLVGEDDFHQKEIIVLHTHGHSDHKAGDRAFEALKNAKVIGVDKKSLMAFLNIKNWDVDNALIDLGGREIIIMPTPGHQEEAIAIYDKKTEWLLTGDTLYPGKVMVKKWSDYKKSINKLYAFSLNNTISAIMGTHIEMKNTPSDLYDIGTTYQPDEAPLALPLSILTKIHRAINSKEKSFTIRLENIIIEPMSIFQKSLSNLARLFRD